MRRALVAARLLLAIAATAGVGLVALLDIHRQGAWGLSHPAWVAVAAGLAAWLLLVVPARRGRTALLLASTLAGALAAEGLLRLFLAPAFTSPYRLDERSLHAYVPNARKLYRRPRAEGGGSVLVVINAEGFRGGPLRERGAGPRVAVFGDSNVAAEFTPLEATFASRLGERLSAALGLPVEAVNAGVVAYGPDQIARRMEEDLPRLAPDLAVVALYADNDYGDLVRNKMFRLDPEGRLVPNRFRVRRSLADEFARSRASLLYNAVQRAWWTVRSRIEVARAPRDAAARASFRMESWLARSREEYEEYLVRGDDEVLHLFDDHYDADVSLAPESESARAKVRLMEAVVRRIAETAERSGVPLFLVIVPSGVDVCGDVDGAQVDLTRFPDYGPSTLSRRLEEIAVRNRIPCLDLFEPFRAHGPGALYFRSRAHWNDAGQDLAARLTADMILARGLLGAGRRGTAPGIP